MNDKSGAKPSGKILFGVDFLYLMRVMEINDDENKKNPQPNFTDGIIRLFLLQWGFSVSEIDEANHLFHEMAKEGGFHNLDIVIERISKLVNNDKEKQERLIIQMAAVGCIDEEITERERVIMNEVNQAFDLRPSEVKALISRGTDWSVALNFIGQAYLEDNPN